MIGSILSSYRLDIWSEVSRAICISIFQESVYDFGKASSVSIGGVVWVLGAGNARRDYVGLGVEGTIYATSAAGMSLWRRCFSTNHSSVWCNSCWRFQVFYLHVLYAVSTLLFLEKGKKVLSERTSLSVLKSNIKNFHLKATSAKSHIGKIKGSNWTVKEYIDLSNMSH